MIAQDLAAVVGRIPPALRAQMHAHPILVAGGFVRSVIAHERVSDVDVFGPTPEMCKTLAAELAALSGVTVIDTDYASTVPGRPPVQYVHRWTFASARELMDHFDFRIVQAAVFFDGQAWRGETAEGFYEDVAAKRLTYVPGDEPESSLLRVVKYARRGYHVAPEELAAVVDQIKSMNRDTRRRMRSIDPLSAEARLERAQ